MRGALAQPWFATFLEGRLEKRSDGIQDTHGAKIQPTIFPGEPGHQKIGCNIQLSKSDDNVNQIARATVDA